MGVKFDDDSGKHRLPENGSSGAFACQEAAVADQSRIRLTRCGDKILVEVSTGAVLVSVADIEQLHTDLELACAPIRTERRAAGR